MTCTICDETKEELYPIEDPWGGLHGQICESCNEEAWESYQSGFYAG